MADYPGHSKYFPETVPVKVNGKSRSHATCTCTSGTRTSDVIPQKSRNTITVEVLFPPPFSSTKKYKMHKISILVFVASPLDYARYRHTALYIQYEGDVGIKSSLAEVVGSTGFYSYSERVNWEIPVSSASKCSVRIAKTGVWTHQCRSGACSSRFDIGGLDFRTEFTGDDFEDTDS